MAKRVIEESTLTAIADAIREKGGTTAGLDPEGEMPQAILDIKGAEIEERDNEAGGKSVYINSEAPEEAVLPEGFTRLKYIQSDGRQHVNTGVYPDQDTRVVIDCKLDTYVTNGSFIFGVRSPGTTNGFAAALVTGPNRSYYNYGSQLGYANIPDIYSRMVIDANGSSAEFLAGADKATITHSPAAFTAEYPLAIGVLIEGGSVYDKTQWIGKIYSGQIYDKGTISRNYIPCLNASGEAGLWDTVTQAFFGDAAGVGFIAGPVVLDYTLPEGFEELEWIQSNGKQFVNAGFKPNNNTRVQMDFQSSASGTSLFGAQEAWGVMSYSLGTNTVSFGASESTSALTLNDGKRHYADFNKGQLYVDGVLKWSGSGTFQLPYNMFVLANNEKDTTTYYSTATLYACQVLENITIIRYYVPCRTNTGEVGLWDVVNSVFYGDAAGVGFIAGPVVGNSVSKVVLENETLIDLTGDTISPETVLAGFIGHDKTGAQFVGELVQKEKGKSVVTGTFTGNNSRQFSLSGLNFTPQGVAIFGSETRASTTVLSLWCYGSVEEYQYARTSYDTTSFDAYYEAQKQSVTSFNTTAGSVQISINSGSFYRGVSFQYVVWGE